MPSLSIQILLVAYAAATGFVAAGIVASLYQMVTAEPARFALLGPSLPAWVLTFLFCAVTGPFILVHGALPEAARRPAPIGRLAGIGLVAVLWSVCSGLLLLDFILAAGSGFA